MSASIEPLNIGRYRIVKRLGRGGQGTVYLGEEPVSKSLVAIKLLWPEQDRLRFQREIDILKRLDHSSIARAIDQGDHGGQPYLVMEYAPGRPLSELIKGPEWPAVGMYRKLQLIAGVAAALRYAHDQGVLHRDVKPSNVIVLPDATTKLVDFGIARPQGKGETITQPGNVVGSPSYLAPEIYQTGLASVQTDVFSMGVVAYEVLAGFNPFHVEVPPEATLPHLPVASRIASFHPEPVSIFAPDCPGEIDALIRSALAKREAERLRDMKALVEGLEAVMVPMRRLEAQRFLDQASRASDSAQVKSCLRRALECDPGNQEAQAGLRKLEFEERRVSVQRRLDLDLPRIRTLLNDREWGKAEELTDRLTASLRPDLLSAEELDSIRKLREMVVLKKRQDLASREIAAAEEALRRGDAAEAKRRIEEAMKASPDHPKALELLAQMERELDRKHRIRDISELLRENRLEDAQLVLETALQEGRTDPELDRLHKKLKVLLHDRAVNGTLEATLQCVRAGDLHAAASRIRTAIEADGPDARLTNALRRIEEWMTNYSRLTLTELMAEPAMVEGRESTAEVTNERSVKGTIFSILKRVDRMLPNHPGTTTTILTPDRTKGDVDSWVEISWTTLILCVIGLCGMIAMTVFGLVLLFLMIFPR